MGSRLVALIAVLAVALAAAAVATAGNGGRPLSATLTGAEEVPGPGDSDAGGQAALRLNQGQERICFRLSWADIDGTVTLAHIHPGVAGVGNTPVLELFTRGWRFRHGTTKRGGPRRRRGAWGACGPAGSADRPGPRVPRPPEPLRRGPLGALAAASVPGD